MRLFLLTPTQWVASKAILFQKVIDLVEAGAHAAQLHIYIVGDQLPAAFVAHFEGKDYVTLLSSFEAEKKISEVTNAKVLHFGHTLKGSGSFPQYFLPLSHPGLRKHPSFFKRIQQRFQFQKWLNKATAVYCTNDWAMESIQQQFPTLTTPIKAVYLPAQPIPLLEWHQLCEVRDALTNGNNYFLCYTQVAHFVDLLKEFSIFKKWQKTTMSLVVLFDNAQQVAAAALLLKGYKYRDAIVLKHSAQLSMNWIAGAYAILLDNANFEHTTVIEWAVQSEVPVLLNQAASLPASWLQSGEVFMFSEKLALSNHFKLYYKDEVYRQAIARKGKEWMQSLGHELSKQGWPHLLNDLAS